MAKQPTVLMKRRINILLVFVIMLGFILMTGRLFFLQVAGGDDYREKATAQQLRDSTIAAKRGTIYDCNMNILAQSATVWTAYLSPVYINDDEEANLIADKLSEILDVDRETVYKKTQKNTYYEYIKRKIEKDKADEIRTFCSENEISAIGLDEDTKRYYPHNNLASTVIGFTGTDNQGLTGIEAYYDSYLKGTDGRVVSAKNAWGTDMPFEYEKRIEAIDGNSLVLTIDQNIQYYVDKHLETAVKEQKVNNRAAAIVMDVKTGEILAMSTKGDFDLNSPFTIYDSTLAEKLDALSGDEKTAELAKLQNQQWRNKVISDPYEPGSVFKIITAAAALEEGVVKENEGFVCTGSYRVGDRNIHCWKTSGHGRESFSDGIMNSCNPVFMTVGSRLGGDLFYKYLEAFGLTEKTGIDLPGEATSITHSKTTLKNAVNLASSSMGQSFKITPIQIITAVSAAVNGGNLVTPHLVKQILDADGSVIENIGPQIKRQVISEETSKKLSLMLERVVAEGTGKNAYIMGYRIGGKTGTSEKLDKVYLEGEKEDYIMSFLGFAPADDPQVACIVIIDEPRAGEVYGSAVAAPVCGSILGDVLPYLGTEPQYTSEELAKVNVTVPNIVGKTAHMGEAALQKYGLHGTIVGAGDRVIKQVPAAGQSVPRGGSVIIYTEENAVQKNVTVPNLIGLTAQEVNTRLTALGLNAKITGGGLDQNGCLSSKQSIAAGEKVPIGTVVEITFLSKDEVQ
ncbi:MAG: PASTA domain-containing protein [Ruminococcaceae bacterium]|nr:PASTA domain-containing protein [Oscillospiraceae bacterium]